ncbi:MAG: RHS repeat domain-containing protein [Saprospiraceae bacterium]
MTYTYNTAGQLTQIGETGSTTKGFKTPGLGSYTYAYDLNGNMTRDNHKNLTLAYNHLNLPRQVLFDNFNEIRLTYTAAGEKITKFTAANTGTETTQNYVSGIEYNGIAVEAVYHEEGRLVPNGTAWHYEYTLKDHLGNSRVMFRANGSTAQLLQENHYYPFGMEMEGAWTAQVGVENKYQYNGKELIEDFGWNWSDYGARGYGASVGRWWSVDPMAEKMVSRSPYNYSFNNPIRFIDPDGNAPDDIVIGSSSRDRDVQRRYQVEVLEELRKLTDDELSIDFETGKVSISRRETNVSRNFGTFLVRAFIEGFTNDDGRTINASVKITDNADGLFKDYKAGEDKPTPVSLKDNAITLPNSVAKSFNGVGSNSTIYFIPTVIAKYFISETERAIAPVFIVLGHEFIHAWFIAQGKRASGDLPGHPAGNQEELNTQIKDIQLFEENNITPTRFVQRVIDPRKND